MKKIALIAVTLVMLASCSSEKDMVIPYAVSTIGTATLNELNLQRNDYEIINTVTAEATISYEINKSGTHIVINGEDDDFQLSYSKDKKLGWQCKFTGILKYGYMQNALADMKPETKNPAEIVRGLAIYRLISQVKNMGGDGMLAPAIMTNVEQRSNKIYFHTTATAKAVRLKIK